MKSQRMSRTSARATAARRPSKVTDEYWIHAEAEAGRGPLPTERSGKWLIFVPVLRIDPVWDLIKIATEQGVLGFESKVATAKPNANATNARARLICVYTYDWKDKVDAMRVREELRKLGITSKISYKADQDTHEGRYTSLGHKSISKYYE